MKVGILLLALVAYTVAAPASGKINPSIRKSLQTKARLNIMVTFEDTKATLSGLSTKGMNHGQKATAVTHALQALAKKSQASVLEMLNSRAFFTTNVKSFWISNQIFVEGADANLIKALATFDEVQEIREEVIVVLEEPIISETQPKAEWGIEKIRAEEAWEVAGNGEGGVVGVIDTGARYTHEAIEGSFRGGSHSWYDPYLMSEMPRDGNGHGTHCTGTIAGSLGIGVAPGAKWISCKGLNDFGFGNENNLIACGEFMLCPHEYSGPDSNPDCTQAPHAVSNSWGGTGGQTFYDRVITAWHGADIIPVFAAGNSGPTCRTIGSPSDSTSRTISVGATDFMDAIAWFSSRGPSDHAEAHKPDISAPGLDIRSSWHTGDDAYDTISGTSMACPHVAGVVTLLKSNNPDADFDTIVDTLISTVVTELSFGTSVCDGIEENVFPNYVFGHGRMDALNAVEAFLK